MAIKASVFSGPTNIMALGHPFVAPGYRTVPGIPVFIDVLSGELVEIDLWRMKDEGIIPALYGLILGEIGVGKSSCLKLLTWRQLMLSAGYQSMRVSINDYKPEGKSSEYAALSEACGSVVFQMGQMSINPFDEKLFLDSDGKVYELGIFNMAIILAEFAKNDTLDEDEHTALRIAFQSMLRYDSALWSPHVLEKKLRSISELEIRDYYDTLDMKLQRQMQRRLQLVQGSTIKSIMADQVTMVMQARDNRNVVRLRAAGERVAKLYGIVLYGAFASMFGNKNSLYDLYTQRAVTKDWRNMTPQAETLMRIIDTTVRITAIENNRHDLLPHIEDDDEKHRSMSNLIYARNNAYNSEISRGSHLASISATHRLGSIRKGGVGSEQYNLGDVIINNQGWVAIGRQQNSPAILNELSERYRLTNANTRLLPRLPQKHFFLVLGETEPPRLVRTFATNTEMRFLKTNAATDRMVTRPDVLNVEDLQRFADENNVGFNNPLKSKEAIA